MNDVMLRNFCDKNLDSYRMGFRRFLSRGKENVLAESILLAMAHNINKLHAKIQSEKTGTHLHKPKKVA